MYSLGAKVLLSKPKLKLTLGFNWRGGRVSFVPLNSFPTAKSLAAIEEMDVH